MMDVNFKGIAPNFAELVISKSSLSIFQTEYSKRIFDECRDGDKDYFYFRWSNKIYAWPISGKDSTRPIAFEPVEISLENNPDVFTKVIQQSVIHYFYSIGRKPHRQKYSSVYDFRIDHSKTRYNISNLSYIPYFCFSVGYFKRVDKNIIYISCWREFRRKFDVSEKEIQEEGIDTSSWDRKNGAIVGSSRNVRLYLSAVRGDQEKKIIEEKISNKINEFDHIKKSFKMLLDSLSKVKVVDGAEIVKLNHFTIPNSYFNDIFISKPEHYYYNNATTRGGYDQAVSNLKPYTYEIMSSKVFNLVAFIPSQHSGTCENFILKLKEKIGSIFHLTKINISYITVGSNRDDHINAISSFGHNEYDLALFFLNYEDKSQPLMKSDYTRLKAKLLGKGIPSQNVLLENVRQLNEFTLKNISLNVYSKLGGTPWIINKDDKSALELVVGIGSSLDENNDRTIGFASVFDYQGSYILGGCSPLSNMASYIDKLKEHVTSILSEAIQLQGVSRQSTIRLIFHLFKDASKHYEIKAILEAVENFADYNIEYSLIHISYQHPFRLYKNEGKDIVPRGTYIEISDGWALLSMGGKQSAPLLIKLDQRSTYKDLYDLSKQVLYFSHLSHKSFQPSSKPVTTKYSGELAKRTSELMTVPYWDIDMLSQLKDKVWFI